MMKVNFYDSINDSMLKFAVIIARHNGKWVFCKHKERNTWEAPGGHREDGEDILETAKRELYEETGAITFDITPICIYSVTAPDNFDGMETFGKLFFSDIHTFEKELHSEIEKIAIMDELPINWTYPEIQPKLCFHQPMSIQHQKIAILFRPFWGKILFFLLLLAVWVEFLGKSN